MSYTIVLGWVVSDLTGCGIDIDICLKEFTTTDSVAFFKLNFEKDTPLERINIFLGIPAGVFHLIGSLPYVYRILNRSGY